MIKIFAPCKINLCLDVTGKRADGYHNIKSIMQTVSLYDEITVNFADEIKLYCSDETLPTDSGNLAYRAAELFFKETGISGGVEISITKNIPVASGLAGGSTDAAGVLKALNELYGSPMSMNLLAEISAVLGADVPFCVKGGTCICEGIGDIMTPIESRLKFSLVIARGGEGVSTPTAYKTLDAMFGENISRDGGRCSALISALSDGDLSEALKNMYNVFESAVLESHSCASLLKDTLYNNGADFAMMSGSGPAVFGIFTDEEKAKNAVQSLKESGYRAYYCETV